MGAKFGEERYEECSYDHSNGGNRCETKTRYHPGFPLVPLNVFYGKKYCLKSYNSKIKKIDMKNSRKESSGCLSSEKKCSGICIDSSNSCPVNSIKLVSNSQAPQNSLAFGPNHSLVFSSSGSSMPITSVQLLLTNPCSNSYFQ